MYPVIVRYQNNLKMNPKVTPNRHWIRTAIVGCGGNPPRADAGLGRYARLTAQLTGCRKAHSNRQGRRRLDHRQRAEGSLSQFFGTCEPLACKQFGLKAWSIQANFQSNGWLSA